MRDLQASYVTYRHKVELILAKNIMRSTLPNPQEYELNTSVMQTVAAAGGWNRTFFTIMTVGLDKALELGLYVVVPIFGLIHIIHEVNARGQNRENAKNLARDAMQQVLMEKELIARAAASL